MRVHTCLTYNKKGYQLEGSTEGVQGIGGRAVG